MLPLFFAGAALIVGAALALLAGARATRAAAAAVASQTVATALTLFAVVPLLAQGTHLSGASTWSFPIELVGLHVDALSAFFLVWSLPMTLLGTIYATGYLKPYLDAGRHGGPHFALLNMVSLSFLIVYSVQNAFVFLLGWEIAAVSAWLLVIWDYKSQRIRFAGFNYLVSTHVGLFVLVAAFMLMHSKTSSMDFASFGAFLESASANRGMVFALLGISFALKSAFFPFHTWLPRAHAAAPAHVSALMSGVIHKAGLFGFLRFTLLMGEPDEWMGWGVLGFGALSTLFGVLYTSSQRDLKRILGYSSTENVGIAAMGFGTAYLGLAWDNDALVVCGLVGGLFHLFNHALFKCLLFYAAGAVYRAAHTVDIERLGGLARKLPVVTVLFLLGALGICALPPLNGFMSEVVIYVGLLSGGAPSDLGDVVLACAAALLAFAGAVSALSMTRAFGISFLGAARDPQVHVDPVVPASMTLPMALHAAGVVVIGLFPGLGLALAEAVTALFLEPASMAAASGRLASLLEPVLWAIRILAALLVIAGAVGWRLGRRARSHVTWGCGYTAANARMQYTGASFSAQLMKTFDGVLPQLRREHLPRELFPPKDGALQTHSIDAVEHRMFEVLGQAERFVTESGSRLPQHASFSFAGGLVALLVIAGLVIFGGGQ